MSEPEVELVGYKEHGESSKEEEPVSKDAPSEPLEVPDPDADRGSGADNKLEPSEAADEPRNKSAATFESSEPKLDLSSPGK